MPDALCDREDICYLKGYTTARVRPLRHDLAECPVRYAFQSSLTIAKCSLVPRHYNAIPIVLAVVFDDCEDIPYLKGYITARVRPLRHDLAECPVRYAFQSSLTIAKCSLVPRYHNAIRVMLAVVFDDRKEIYYLGAASEARPCGMPGMIRSSRLRRSRSLLLFQGITMLYALCLQSSRGHLCRSRDICYLKGITTACVWPLRHDLAECPIQYVFVPYASST
jgi:hypothetical protein